MISAPRAALLAPKPGTDAQPSSTEDPLSSAALSYGRSFWLAYIANTLLSAGVALLYRYADFVTLLGGTEFHLGWIVGVGMVGSLATRLAMGSGIDRYGPRLIWLGSLLVFAASCLAHVAIASPNGLPIYGLRIVWCSAVAGVFGASMTFISGRASMVRIAEMVGMLGTSGFVGVVLGTQLGDLLLGSRVIDRWQIDQMFVVAGLLGLAAMPFVWAATRGDAVVRHRSPPSMVEVLRRYHPGAVLMVGVAMGIGLGLPGTFLRTYAAEIHIPRMGMFFMVFSAAAIITRIATRRMPQRYGVTPLILAGLAGVAVSQLLLLLVKAEWHLLVPGIGYGMAHAILFPAVVAAGAGAFPYEHRGLGTTLMLATWDVGQLVGAPTAGAIVHFSGDLGLPGYPTLFISLAVLLTLVGIGYAAIKYRETAQRTKGDMPPAGRLVQPVREPAPKTHQRSRR